MSPDAATDSATDTAYAVALASLPMMGPGRLRALLTRWPPRVAWRVVQRDTACDEPGVAAACGSEAAKVRALWVRASAIDPAKALANATEQGIAVHVLGEPGYPVELSGDHEAPSVCFVLGDASKLSSP
jgi:predicted Rossmann fold nucleotide-binding protein DprA/Smf involved in DNA uptake